MESAIELSARRARGTRAEGARNPKLNFVRSRGGFAPIAPWWDVGSGSGRAPDGGATHDCWIIPFDSNEDEARRREDRAAEWRGFRVGSSPNRKGLREDFYRRTAQPISDQMSSRCLAAWCSQSVLAGKICPVENYVTQQPLFFGREVERSRPARPTICRVSSTLDVAEASLRYQNSRRGRPTRA